MTDPSSSSAPNSPFPLSLRPWPNQGEKDEPLIIQLARISHQFGQYRHVTEEKLQGMIIDEEAGIVQTAEGQDEEEEETADDVKKRVEELAKAKGEMFRHINDAQQEVLYAIDFLGLLLSKDSARAKDQMSPALKTSGIPEGSFGYDKWPVKQPDARQKKQEDLVAKGWTMDSLGTSADNLLQAATRLEKEVRKETQYWGQILSITKKGWSLRRVPREPGTLGVSFGFAEASDQFKARGFAPLRTRDDGSIILDQTLVQQPKSVRVRIVQDGKVVGSSHQGSLAFAPHSDQEIEDLIRRARDSLFEQELFHEMAMETRGLLSNNVRFRDNVIIIPTGLAHESEDEVRREIHVDLILLEEAEELLPDHTDDQLARDIAVALRMLLSHAHRQRLKRRSMPPAPLTERKRVDQPPPMIRTLLNYIHHYAATNHLRSYLEAHSRALTKAGLQLSFDLERTQSNIKDLMDEKRSAISRVTFIDMIMSALTHPLQATFSITLPSSASDSKPQQINIVLRTLVQPPIQGTEIMVSLPATLTRLLYLDAPGATNSQKRLTFDTMNDLTSYLDVGLAIDIVHNLLKSELSGFRAIEREPELETLFKVEAPSVESKPPKKTLRIGLQLSGPGVLKAKACPADGESADEEIVWSGNKDEVRPLREVIKKLAGTGN
ncbi:uncharacterized protein K452DRAFT_356423 [Aplosporella prunicola CBS 121167]|uniref:Mediator of RNA polymerase II transcription subunit 17 n=1 Tax=Aplosporella prunicola CBS 121167 TaxID=1176127 RepID=A0A6A6BLW8_9PEZI|nr:uncharacterized protein K452DRAFT_356423 [Aplosporella prunicola CBS 121167]KAF2145102.1 hypothetical protein K452DRAFT_356423 [Aplosporella prunicola CBS 121167]